MVAQGKVKFSIHMYAKEHTLVINKAKSAILQVGNTKDISLPIFTIDDVQLTEQAKNLGLTLYTD